MTVPRGLGFQVLLDELLQAEGMTPRISFESADLITIEGLVGAGLGWPFCPSNSSARPAPPASRWRRPELSA